MNANVIEVFFSRIGDPHRSIPVELAVAAFTKGIDMETGEFIIARWVLTFGLPLAWAVYELWRLGQARAAAAAAAA